jgi:hypothetical protein
MDFKNMSLGQLLEEVPKQMELLRNSIPLEKRHEFNAVEQKVKKAIAAGDMSAVLELQKKYQAYSNPFAK